LVDNVQISIENIHLRYEDNLSTPEVSLFCVSYYSKVSLICTFVSEQHPFAAGVTLSSFKAVSADENWIEAFIQNSSEGVRKVSGVPVVLALSLPADHHLA
jgi:vacuolar protein sorting-associated protein 13A/C